MIKKIIEWLKGNFKEEAEQDVLINYAEKREKGLEISEAEKEQALKTAIKITKKEPSED